MYAVSPLVRWSTLVGGRQYSRRDSDAVTRRLTCGWCEATLSFGRRDEIGGQL